MSIKYTEEHDICFWKKSFSNDRYSIEKPTFAWEDWGLIPISRPYVSVPKVNYTLAQVPNSSNMLNITNFMPGGMTYESRTGEWQFAIDHTKEIWKNWFDGYYKIEEYFHGSRMLVSLNDDAEKIYEGRISISAYDPGENYSTVTLNYDIDAMPIDETLKGTIPFRLRWFDYTGKLLYTRFEYFGTNMGIGYYYMDISMAVPTGAIGKGWDPQVGPVKGNTDYVPKYYFLGKIVNSVPVSMVRMSSIVSSHPIQYIIEEPEEKVEETYELPDTVKFLFNNVQFSIDVLGSGGSTQKRLWYTPNNLGIETEE